MKKTSATRVGLYARVSQDRDGTAASPQRQLDDARKLAEGRGWTVVGEYVDRDKSAYSGKTRPEYERMLSDVREGVINGFVVWKFDRLTRRVQAVGQLLDLVETHGAVITSVNDAIDTTTPMGKALLGVLAGIAESESESTSKRIKRAVEQQVADGRFPITANRCYGYEVDGTIIPAEQTVAEWIVDAYVSGTNFRQLAKALNDKGERTTAGNEWTGVAVSGWLRAPRIGGYRLSADKTTLVEGKWAPLIDGERWAALQRALSGSRTPARRRHEAQHLTTGLVQCGTCGERMKYVHVRQVKNGKPYELDRIACVKDVGKKSCGGPSAPESAVNALLRLDVAELVHNAKGTPTIDVDAITALIEADKRALTELTNDRYVTRKVTPEGFDIARAALEESIAANTVLIETTPATTGHRFKGYRLSDMRDFWKNAPLPVQRALVRQHVEKVVIHPAKVRGGNQFDASRVSIVPR